MNSKLVKLIDKTKQQCWANTQYPRNEYIEVVWQPWIFSPFSEKIWDTFVSISSIFTKHGMRTISRHVNNLYLYFGYWAFAQHCCSVFSIYSTNLIFTFLAIATPASSLLKLLFKTLISTTRDVTRDDIAIWHLQNHVN